MSYWSHNPELFTEIIFNQMVREGLAKEDEEDIEEVVSKFLDKADSYKLVTRAEQDYWGSKIDEAEVRYGGRE